MSEDKARSFFINKSGKDEVLFNYNSNLDNYKKIIVFLPDQVEDLYVYLPFILHLKEIKSQQDLVLFTSSEHLNILTGLSLANYSIFFNKETFFYGEENFKTIDETISNGNFNLSIMLDHNLPLLKLYLCRKSLAQVKLGINAENQYPFINLSLKPKTENPSTYACRNTLFKHFKLPENEILKNAAMCHLNSAKNNSSEEKLASKKVVLINMEEDLDGKAWTEQQLKYILKYLKEKDFRLLALFTNNRKQIDLKNTVSKLGISISSISSSSITLLDALPQYKALITRNSAHYHMCLNLGHTPALLVCDIDKTSFKLPQELISSLLISADSDEINAKQIQELLKKAIVQ